MRNKINVNNAGFTVIEMIVVVGIIAAISGIFLANFNSLNGPRDLKKSQKQLVTDIRKIQSYTLSSRNLNSSGVPSNYYIIKFSLENPGSYTIAAIDNENNYSDLETINLPKNITISGLSVKLPSASPSTEPIHATCAETAFSLPFGRIFTDYIEAKKNEEIKESEVAGGKDKDKGKEEKEEGDNKELNIHKECGIAQLILKSGDLTETQNLVLTISLSDTSNPGSPAQTVTINGISQAIGSSGSGGSSSGAATAN